MPRARRKPKPPQPRNTPVASVTLSDDTEAYLNAIREAYPELRSRSAAIAWAARIGAEVARSQAATLTQTSRIKP